MIRVGIAGATGYTGFELVKLLQRHPQAEVVFTTSESSAGGRLSDVFPCPYHYELLPLADAPLDTADVVFLCLPHAASMDAVRRVRQAGKRAIDLSADFRLTSPDVYQRWYQVPHSAPELLAEAVYGLVEVYRHDIREADLVANPGCYPTSVNLALYPLAKRGLLASRIIVDAKSGVSGAGRGLKLTTHFVEANENLSPYSIGYQHRHIAEMEQVLHSANGANRREGLSDYEIIFSPHLLPVNRGILSTIYVDLTEALTPESISHLYHETYVGEPFIHLLPLGQVATLRHTVETNRCAIGLTPLPARDDGSKVRSLIITASIDNLIKGASGQALQNLNVMFSLDERYGLI